MTSIAELQARSHQTAVDKGWWDSYRQPDGRLHFPNMQHVADEKIALIHSELSEALEDYRTGAMATMLSPSGKPVGFPTEIADVVIRWMDVLDAFGVDLACSDKTVAEVSPDAYMELRNRGWFIREDLTMAERGDDSVVPGVICRMHWNTSALHGRLGVWSSREVSSLATSAVCDAFAIAWHLKFDLEREIRIKQDFNDKRPHRHGGKRA